MNHKGLTIVELIGAIVILGISLSLLTLLISFVINANDQTSINASANQIGTLAIRTITTSLEDLDANAYLTSITDNEISLLKEYEYAYDEEQQKIILDVYDLPIIYDLSIQDGDLNINGDLFDFNIFTLSNDSSLTYYESNQTLYIDIVLILVASNLENSYTFNMTYSMDINDIPQV